MYPKQFFIEQFSKIPTEDLLLKLATSDLAENASDAISDILNSRGISKGEINVQSKEAHKALFRQSKGTTECDYCGNSAKYMPIFDAGQRFCSKKCLHAARVSESAVDLSKVEIEQEASKIRSGACPECNQKKSPVEMRFYHMVISYIVLTRYTRKSRLCCARCGRKRNREAMLATALLGWWGFPWGVFMTPTYLIANLGEMFEKRKSDDPSEDLIREAKYRLAELALKNKVVRIGEFPKDA